MRARRPGEERRRSRVRLCALPALLIAAFALPRSAAAEVGLPSADNGRVRLELWGGDTFTGRGEWLHDAYVAHAVEFEWMLWPHVSMGLRAIPVLVYLDDPPIVGSALGFTNRLYWNGAGTGFYVGPQIALLAHYGRFDGNSAFLNLMSSLELGYRWTALPLRLGVKLEHVSNAGLARENRGWNGLALLLGWAAWP